MHAVARQGAGHRAPEAVEDGVVFHHPTATYNGAMTATAIDTLKFANRLKQAGVPQEQAEAQTQAIVEALADARGDLATKADMQALESKVDKGFAEVKGEMTLVKWMLGSLMALALGIAMKLFLHG
jgi:hypothetical protein